MKGVIVVNGWMDGGGLERRGRGEGLVDCEWMGRFEWRGEGLMGGFLYIATRVQCSAQ